MANPISVTMFVLIGLLKTAVALFVLLWVVTFSATGGGVL